jgi:hypothetical protein
LVQYAKRGIPSTLRNRIYKKILYADITQKEVDYFNTMMEKVKRWEIALDDLVGQDLMDTCNDDKYFIF